MNIGDKLKEKTKLKCPEQLQCTFILQVSELYQADEHHSSKIYSLTWYFNDGDIVLSAQNLL